VAGGLLTVALNLRKPGLADPDDPLNLTDGVAPTGHFLLDDLPVAREVIKGNEVAAREAVLRIGREKIAAAVEKLNGLPTHKKPAAGATNPLDESVELVADSDGKWSIRQLQDLPRMIIGLALTEPDPTVMFWGSYDETGPGEWSVWTMLVPPPEK
jgi:hypothetical protein